MLPSLSELRHIFFNSRLRDFTREFSYGLNFAIFFSTLVCVIFLKKSFSADMQTYRRKSNKLESIYESRGTNW